MKTLYLECNMGVAGDMLMSSLYEICGQRDSFLEKMNRLFAADGLTLRAAATAKCGICGTHMEVSIGGVTENADEPEDAHHHEHGDSHHHEHSHEHGDSHHHEHSHEHGNSHHHEHSHEHGDSHSHTSYAAVLAQIKRLDLPEQVKTDAAAVYRLIGEAEAKVHGTSLEQIHFHEVGTLDALADVVGCALLIHLIAPERILASPVHVGNGFVKCAHGVLPVPAPATAELLKGIPFYTGSVTGELCTPTGAALLKYYAEKFCAMPALAPTAIGYGMGSKNFEIANCLRAFLGEADAEDGGDEAKEDGGFAYDDKILAVSCNIDDMTGEAIGLATEIFLTAGALDVYTTPIQMKKNRPGVLLTCICELSDRDKFTGLFFLHTSTRGLRFQTFERAKLESTFEARPTSYGNIRVKKSTGYGIKKEKPEFEDLKTVVLKNECAVSLEDVAKSVR